MPRWIQDRNTGKLIPAEEYKRPAQTHMIIEDVKPFKSPIDGTVISSRPHLEAHNRRHGVTNSADYPKEWVAKRAKERLREQERDNQRHRHQTLQQAYEKLRG